MLTDAITNMDIQILNWIQENLRCSALDIIVPFITFLGNKGWLFIVLAVILIGISRYRKWGASIAVSLSLGLIFGNMVLKNVVARVRPYDFVEGIELLIAKLSDYSFPSGHTLAAMEFCTVVCMMPVRRIYKVLAILLTMAMAFSRLYLYVHFPSDVLASVLLGGIFGVMGVRIVEMVTADNQSENRTDI
ncbi:MAG: phosphatase PAP2 family protein [Lachnospiraceae bacterium]|nr:phosphatase PAP2 family protein [Lachnospiraceae bacterium]